MSLSAGSRLGPYEIVSMLGAGGMGEVYRARDTRLARTVALKVIHPDVAGDPARRARFKREAKAVSSLNHPHIGTLHDVGEQDGVDFLVMEYVEGETLAQRLCDGPLGLEPTLRLGAQMAEALHAAHRQHIVHRDLKPGNVMLTKSGVKLLDFGLAKLRREEEDASNPGESTFTRGPTGKKPLTDEGVVMGTVPYMAPEQLEGRPTDARTDIFALGAVLHEMATGERAFKGESRASLIAAILKEDPPPVSSRQPLSPPAFDRLVRTCLAKDPDERWQSAHDVARELRWMTEAPQGGTLPGPLPRRLVRQHLALVVALALSLVAIAALLVRGRPESRDTLHLSLSRPARAPYVFFDSAVLSAQGRKIVFQAWSTDGRVQLWLRDLGEAQGHPLPETGQAQLPFWSPDGRSIGFFADGKLKRVEAAGGPARVLCDAPDPQGGTWNEQGVIVFGARFKEGLSRVSAGGGAPAVLTRLLPREEAHRWPSFLPDGRHFVFLGDAARLEDHHLRIGSLDSPEIQDVVPAVSNALVAPSGHLLFVRDGHLLAQPFDLRRLRAVGEPVSLGDQIVPNSENHRFEFTTSSTGLLAFRSAAAESQLAWYDRAGKKLETVGEPGRIGDFTLSPEGTRVAFERRNAAGRLEDLWLLDLPRGTTTRLTTDRVGSGHPRWSPDGKRIVFTSFRSGLGDLYQLLTDDPTQQTLLFQSPNPKSATDVSPDGRTIVFGDVSAPPATTKGDVWALSWTGEPKAEPLLQSAFDEFSARISPSGRWMAYVSDESGRREVYVRRFPHGPERRQVSTGGGVSPRWRDDGRELFFTDASWEHVMAVDIAPGPALEAGRPRELFRIAGAQGYAVAAGGQRFLINVQSEDVVGAPLTVVVDWTARLPR